VDLEDFTHFIVLDSELYSRIILKTRLSLESKQGYVQNVWTWQI
jgi:hypothetical protein